MNVFATSTTKLAHPKPKQNIGSGYWRFVDEWQDLVYKAKELKLRTIFGTGFAKLLKMI